MIEIVVLMERCLKARAQVVLDVGYLPHEDDRLSCMDADGLVILMSCVNDVHTGVNLVAGIDGLPDQRELFDVLQTSHMPPSVRDENEMRVVLRLNREPFTLEGDGESILLLIQPYIIHIPFVGVGRRAA